MGNANQMVGSYNILRRLQGGRLTKKFHVKDGSGQERTIIIPDKEKCVTKYMFESFTDKEEITDTAKAEAEKRFEKDIAEFKRRYERAIGLAHPNVAETFAVELDEESKVPFAVLEYVPGNQITQEARHLMPLQMIHLFAQILEGIRFIHGSNLLHLNIKSERVMASYESDGYKVKITDLGFAIPMDNIETENKGTATYIAPEVALGLKDHVGKKADLFSAGVLFYYCIAKKLPFPGRMAPAMSNILKLRREIEGEPLPAPLVHYDRMVPVELDAMILDMLKKSPEDRPFESAEDVLDLLNEKWPNECKTMPIEGTITFNKEEG